MKRGPLVKGSFCHSSCCLLKSQFSAAMTYEKGQTPQLTLQCNPAGHVESLYPQVKAHKRLSIVPLDLTDLRWSKNAPKLPKAYPRLLDGFKAISV